jgi:YD repeat-containing protein
VYQPYLSSAGQCATLGPSGVLANDIAFDAAGRPLRVLESDAPIYGRASVSRNEYAPLRVVSWDAEDSDPASPHANTPESATSDGLGRLIEQQRLVSDDANPIGIRLTYDGVGRIRSLLDEAGNEQWQRYDALGRVIEVMHPDSGRTTYLHDDVNNVVARTDARGVTTRNSYDEANRVTGTWDDSLPSSTVVGIRYDGDCTGGPSSCANAEGQVTEVSYPLLLGEVGRERSIRDVRGREVGRQVERGTRRYVFVNAFDNADRLVERTFPDGTTLSFVYDGASRLASVPGYVSQMRYDARGLLALTRFENGTESAQTYDERLRLASLRTTPSSASGAVQALSYTWDRVGNLLRVDDAREVGAHSLTENARYEYDALYRLTNAVLDGGRDTAESVSYAYDRLDNTTSIVSSLGARSAVHVHSLRYGEGGAGPHSVTTAGRDAYAYDAAGQMVERMGLQHAWDHLGRLSHTPQCRA